MKGFALGVLLLAAVPVFAQTITIEGNVEKPLTISKSDLEKLPAVEVKSKDKEGADHLYKGVNLFNVIQSAGIPSTNKSFLSYIQITAADNYKVIFTMAELDPAFASQIILLATSVDGKPVPFHVIAPNDKKHARWIKEVASIKLVVVQ